MTIRKTDETALGAEWLDETERQDWNRYGLAPGSDAAAPAHDAAAKNVGTNDRGRDLGARLKSSVSQRTPVLETPQRTDDPDELFLSNRGESNDKEYGPAGSSRSPRAVANLVTVSVVGAIGVLAMVIAVASSAI